jgi:predicted O-methyltransferase YrrM
MVTRALEELVARFRQLSARRGEAKLRRRLRETAGYDFTVDYISGLLESWNGLFGALAERPVRFLEIGSYEGRSTVWFLENILRHPGSTITCIDIFSEPRWDLRFDHNVRASQHAAKVRKLKGRSADHLVDLAGQSFDVIYIDGSHDAADVLLDATLSWPLLAPAGILLFDDYEWEPDKPVSERPQLAIDLFLDAIKGQFALLYKNYQVAVRKLGFNSVDVLSADVDNSSRGTP